MQYKNYYASFLAIYDECYADIVKMMKNKGVTRLEHQYAGMAMQGILSNQEYVHSLVQRVASREILNLAEGITKHAEQLAHALVQKLKEKEERK